MRAFRLGHAVDPYLIRTPQGPVTPMSPPPDPDPGYDPVRPIVATFCSPQQPQGQPQPVAPLQQSLPESIPSLAQAVLEHRYDPAPMTHTPDPVPALNPGPISFPVTLLAPIAIPPCPVHS